MPARHYSSTASLMHLTSGASALDTVIFVDTTAGLPSAVPYTLVLDPGQVNEEIITVSTLPAGLTLTVVRGEDGTVGASHNAGAEVMHDGTGRDLGEPQSHIYAPTGVHGIGNTSSVVGTTDTQTLTGKSMSGGTNTFTNIPKSAIPSDTVYLATAQTLLNKALTAPTFTSPTTDTLHATGILTVDGATHANDTQVTTLEATGAVTLSTTLAVTGNETVGGTLGVTGQINGSTLALSGAATVAGALQVTGDATAAHLVGLSMTPTLSFQVSDAAYGATGSYQDFGSTPWPAFTFVVPPSGRVRVDVTGTVTNNNTTTSNITLTYKMAAPSESITAPGSGSTQSNVFQDSAGVIYSASGAGRTALTQASFGILSSGQPSRQTTSMTFKLTPGETITLTPQYRISSGSSSTASTSGGVITVTPLA